MQLVYYVSCYYQNLKYNREAVAKLWEKKHSSSLILFSFVFWMDEKITSLWKGRACIVTLLNQKRWTKNKGNASIMIYDEWDRITLHWLTMNLVCARAVFFKVKSFFF